MSSDDAKNGKKEIIRKLNEKLFNPITNKFLSKVINVLLKIDKMSNFKVKINDNGIWRFGIKVLSTIGCGVRREFMLPGNGIEIKRIAIILCDEKSVG